jgi:hypothetical protein
MGLTMICSKLSRILISSTLSSAALLVAGAASPAAAQGGPIVLGEPVAGLVTAERGDSWTIDLRQGMFLRIDLARERTSSLNPEIALVGEGGRVIATARAAAGTGTVRLMVSCLPRNGRYSVVARSIEGRLGGRYSLKVEPIMVAAELGPETVPCAATDEANERGRGECAGPALRIEAGGEAVRVPRGETRHVVLAAGATVRWSCDPQAAGQASAQAPAQAEEQVACGDGSTLLRVSRQAGGRAVEWTCFARHFVDGPDDPRIGERTRLTGTDPDGASRADAAPVAR